MGKIKNIIFDLGNVLIDIDYAKTTQAFEQLGFKNFNHLYLPDTMGLLFKNLETGKISEAEFYKTIKSLHPQPITNTQIKNAWNSLLVSFRTESLLFLETICTTYSLYLLSNTNSIHITAFNKMLKQQTKKNCLDDYFTKAYYSNIIGLRKPDKNIYEHILHDAHLIASQTLFIDDLKINIDGAKTVGLHTHHLQPEERIEFLNL